MADLGILQLAGSQPFVLLSEPGGELGDGLAIGFGKLAAIQIGRDRRRGELGALGQPGERIRSSAGVDSLAATSFSRDRVESVRIACRKGK